MTTNIKELWFAPSPRIPIDVLETVALPDRVSHLQLYSGELNRAPVQLPRPIVIEAGATKDHSPDAEASWVHVAAILERDWPINGVSIDEPLTAMRRAGIDRQEALAGTRRFIQRCRMMGLQVGLIEALPYNSVHDIVAFADALEVALDWLHLDIDRNTEIHADHWWSGVRRRMTWQDVNALCADAHGYARDRGWELGVIAWPSGGSMPDRYEADTKDAVRHIYPDADRLIVQSWEANDTDLASQIRRLPAQWPEPEEAGDV